MSRGNFLFELNFLLSLIIIPTLCSLTVLEFHTAPPFFDKSFHSIYFLHLFFFLSLSSFSLLTTEFLQRLLRVSFPVAALPDVTCLQLYHHLHARQGTSTRFQVHLGKQLPASSPWLIVHALVPTFKGQILFGSLYRVSSTFFSFYMNKFCITSLLFCEKRTPNCS